MKSVVLILAVALVAMVFVSPADAQCRASGNGQCNSLSNSNVQTPQAPIAIPAPSGASASSSSSGGFISSPQAMRTSNPFDDQVVDNNPMQLTSCPTALMGRRAGASRSVSRSVSISKTARAPRARRAVLVTPVQAVPIQVMPQIRSGGASSAASSSS
jgi:hypothetical protein